MILLGFLRENWLAVLVTVYQVALYSIAFYVGGHFIVKYW